MSPPNARNLGLQALVLQVLDTAGGTSKPNDVYQKMKEVFPIDSPSEQDRLEKAVAFARLLLRQKGYIDGTERGVWKITVAGQQWLLENLPDLPRPSGGGDG